MCAHTAHLSFAVVVTTPTGRVYREKAYASVRVIDTQLSAKLKRYMYLMPLDVVLLENGPVS